MACLDLGPTKIGGAIRVPYEGFAIKRLCCSSSSSSSSPTPAEEAPEVPTVTHVAASLNLSSASATPIPEAGQFNVEIKQEEKYRVEITIGDDGDGEIERMEADERRLVEEI